MPMLSACCLLLGVILLQTSVLGFFRDLRSGLLGSESQNNNRRIHENSLEDLLELESTVLKKRVDDDESISRTCHSDYFQCSSTKACIDKTWRCNGHVDCIDGSDEKNCQSKECENARFRCLDGRCLPHQWVCDGENDCIDGSDERDCKTNQSTPCPRGFVHVDSVKKCYLLIHDIELSKENAAYWCGKRHFNADLITIGNKDEQDSIVDHMTKAGKEMCPNGLWTSGQRSHAFSPFTWHNRTGPSRVNLTYTEWAINRPWVAFALKRNCIYLDKSKAWKWNQRSCDHRLCAMCQIDL